MKKNIPVTLSLLCAFLGVICLVTRFWYFSAAFDQKGLLTAHPGSIMSWVLTALAAGGCLFLALTRKPQITFPNTRLAYGSAAAQVIAMATVARQLLSGSTLLETVAGVLAILAALAAGVQLFARASGKTIPPLSRFPLVLFFLVYFLCVYQRWSAQPQTALYVFSLLSLACLTLTAYQRAALSLEEGSSTLYLLFSGGAVFFSLAAVPKASNWQLYLFMALAVLLDVCVEKAPQEA